MRPLILVLCLSMAMLDEAGVAAAAADAAAQATRPATADAHPTDIQRRVLLASLSAYSSRARWEAQVTLSAMADDSVEPGLVVAAATGSDDDARQRARTILEQIRTRRRFRQLMEPTRVSLHFDQAPARQVLASLYVRAGAEFRTFPPDPWESAGDDPVTIHLDDVPFWDAVSKLEEVTGLTLIDTRWGASFKRVPGELHRRRVSVHGPFRVMAEDGPMRGSIASLKVFLEPKIQVASHAQQAKLLARGGDGDQREPLAQAWLADRRTHAHVVGRSYGVLDVELPLDALIQPIAHVKGTIPALLVAREETVEVERLYPGWGRADVAGRSFNWQVHRLTDEVHVVRIIEPQWQLLRAPYSPPPPVPPVQLPALATELPDVRLTLYDARGVPLLRSPTVKMLGAGDFERTFEQRLPGDPRAKPAGDGRAGAGGAGGADVPAAPLSPPQCGPPARLKLALPTVTRQIEIPFEFGPGPDKPAK